MNQLVRNNIVLRLNPENGYVINVTQGDTKLWILN